MQSSRYFTHHFIGRQEEHVFICQKAKLQVSGMTNAKTAEDKSTVRGRNELLTNGLGLTRSQ